jgi:branched-chain amino acid transport system substrate-binding protein
MTDEADIGKRSELTRRGFLGATGLAVGGGLASLAGCSSALKSSTSPSSTSGGTIKIGFISPETGELSVFTQSNGFVLSQVRAALAKGLTIGGKKYSVDIISGDSQSSSARAAAVASQMVQQDSVDFLLATATPETVIPVSAQAEASGVPCVLTICPWEQWYYKSNGSANTFKYSYMYSSAPRRRPTCSRRSGRPRPPTMWSAACGRTTSTAPGSRST